MASQWRGIAERLGTASRVEACTIYDLPFTMKSHARLDWNNRNAAYNLGPLSGDSSVEGSYLVGGVALLACAVKHQAGRSDSRRAAALLFEEYYP